MRRSQRHESALSLPRGSEVASSAATVRTGCIEGVLAGTGDNAKEGVRSLALVSRSAVHQVGAAGQATRTQLLVEQLDGQDMAGVPRSFRSTIVPPGLRTVRLPQGCRWTSAQQP